MFLFFTFYCLKVKSLPVLLTKQQEWDFCKYYPVIIAYKKALSKSDLMLKISPRPRNAKGTGKSIKLHGISWQRSFFHLLQQN